MEKVIETVKRMLGLPNDAELDQKFVEKLEQVKKFCDRVGDGSHLNTTTLALMCSEYSGVKQEDAVVSKPNDNIVGRTISYMLNGKKQTNEVIKVNSDSYTVLQKNGKEREVNIKEVI